LCFTFCLVFQNFFFFFFFFLFLSFCRKKGCFVSGREIVIF